jgi:pyridoxamine 5'-phosphate oxidase
VAKAQSAHTEFDRGTLRRRDLDPDPVCQFKKWFENAANLHAGDAAAMALATASAQGLPSVRMVLLKSFGTDGFIFATSYGGRKAREILENPHASVLFFWEDLEQQIRIEGTIGRTLPEVSDSIFEERPLGSRIAALTSRQSDPIASRDELELAYAANVARYDGSSPKRPESWGGYVLTPERFEFWQGGVNRLHDRFEYRRVGDAWKIARLQP